MAADLPKYRQNLLVVLGRIKMSHMADHISVCQSVFLPDPVSFHRIISKAPAVNTVRYYCRPGIPHNSFPEYVAAGLFRTSQKMGGMETDQPLHPCLIGKAGRRPGFAGMRIMGMRDPYRYMSFPCLRQDQSGVEEDMAVNGMKRSLFTKDHAQIGNQAFVCVKIENPASPFQDFLVIQRFLPRCHGEVKLDFVRIHFAIQIHDIIGHAAGIEACKDLQHPYRFIRFRFRFLLHPLPLFHGHFVHCLLHFFEFLSQV